MPETQQVGEAARAHGPKLTEAISAAMVELYAALYGHDRTTATTYINDKIVVCVLENILTERCHVLVGVTPGVKVAGTPRRTALEGARGSSHAAGHIRVGGTDRGSRYAMPCASGSWTRG